MMEFCAAFATCVDAITNCIRCGDDDYDGVIGYRDFPEPFASNTPMKPPSPPPPTPPPRPPHTLPGFSPANPVAAPNRTPIYVLRDSVVADIGKNHEYNLKCKETNPALPEKNPAKVRRLLPSTSGQRFDEQRKRHELREARSLEGFHRASCRPARSVHFKKNPVTNEGERLKRTRSARIRTRLPFDQDIPEEPPFSAQETKELSDEELYEPGLGDSPTHLNTLENYVAEFPELEYPSPRSSNHQYKSRHNRMKPLEDHERKIIIEFCHLLEKSKQLFCGLRELPAYGHKQWHAYFGKTFDIYTKLWKFQQVHRTVLDTKYGLKRWQIGEIASKIGQLYYHFYLRTSDTAYLSEAFSFYHAIRGRSYYTQACKEDKCELMVKKLRYYARFIVAGLLLKKLKLVSDLLKELDKQIIEYGNAYEPDDQNEWKIVADEVRTFIKVEPIVTVYHPNDYVVYFSHRLAASLITPIDRTSSMTLVLQEVLIVGSNSTQLKFSELTMDMYRMMQTLEREPNDDIQVVYDESPRQRSASTPSAVNNKGYNLDPSPSKNDSPHKYLLFKPSPNQIFVYLASACDDLLPNGVVLLYLSAEGYIVPYSKNPEEAGGVSGYDVGGLITTSKTDVLQKESALQTTKEGKPIIPKHREIPVLYPGDLYPFTRRPMVLIVDSNNSFVFGDLPRFFRQPLIILMSPIELPSTIFHDQRVEGSLFTLFLHCPLSAICLICDINKMGLLNWERGQTYIDTFLKEATSVLVRIRSDSIYVSFMGDDFLRLLILRFIFCETILRLHRAFRGRAQHTRCSPPLPEGIYEHPTLTNIVVDLITHLQVRAHFHDPTAAAPSNRE